MTHQFLTSVHCPFNLQDKLLRACMRPPKALLENARELYLPVSKVIQTRMHANSDMHAHRMRVCLMQPDLLLLTPSLNDRSKLKRQYTDVKSGCVTSV